MNDFFELDDNRRRLVIDQTAVRIGLPEQAVEKDLWVTTMLQVVFSMPYADKILFKGGSSLAKIGHLISRFSEDIDLAFDRSLFGRRWRRKGPPLSAWLRGCAARGQSGGRLLVPVCHRVWSFTAACRREWPKRWKAPTEFTAVQRAGARRPVRCADGNLVGACVGKGCC